MSLIPDHLIILSGSHRSIFGCLQNTMSHWPHRDRAAQTSVVILFGTPCFPKAGINLRLNVLFNLIRQVPKKIVPDNLFQIVYTQRVITKLTGDLLLIGKQESDSMVTSMLPHQQCFIIATWHPHSPFDSRQTGCQHRAGNYIKRIILFSPSTDLLLQQSPNLSIKRRTLRRDIRQIKGCSVLLWGIVPVSRRKQVSTIITAAGIISITSCRPPAL